MDGKKENWERRDLLNATGKPQTIKPPGASQGCKGSPLLLGPT